MFVQFLISAAGWTGILQEETHHPECFERSELTGQEWWPAAKHQCSVFLAAAHLSVQPGETLCSPPWMTSALKLPRRQASSVWLNASAAQLFAFHFRLCKFL